MITLNEYFVYTFIELSFVFVKKDENKGIELTKHT